jgi:hypothetical protein
MEYPIGHGGETPPGIVGVGELMLMGGGGIGVPVVVLGDMGLKGGGWGVPSG